MHARLFSAGTLAIALLTGGALTSAQATVIGDTPDTDFSGSPLTFGFGDGQAAYTLSQVLQNPVFGPSGGVIAGVATSGSGLVSQSTINPDTAAAFTQDVLLGPDQTVGGDYVAFSDTASTQISNTTPYLGLQFILDDGVHYGYAQADDFTLSSFAYQSDPGVAIATGVAIEQTIGQPGAPTLTPTDVPEPSSLLMYGLGLLGLATTLLSYRRRSDRLGSL